VPVISRSGEVIGGLFFGHGEPGKFVNEHEELLIGIAGQAATAVDNARLFQAAEREVGERRRAEEAPQDTRNAIVHNGMLDPGANLLTKPFRTEELVAKIRKILDDRT
jgi:GAF domain-containing protein